MAGVGISEMRLVVALAVNSSCLITCKNTKRPIKMAKNTKISTNATTKRSR